MSYKVLFSNQAKKFFKSLENIFQERLKKKFEEISNDPLRYVEHYEGDYFKIRIGEFRALVDLDQKNKIIFIRVFDKRGRIYK